ncbi:cyclic nucleotide-gated ion channel 1 [Corchorus olitorius]|uniref:Cyclic nucleotide-gated ion channel 1 n=1 Tax=Corchorus olitorius TaxID=93759 RepID=A0A1R3FW91_9ROSI|nr:cyclic nucleotide-gated ion channel 1 [Corchorus olitorius]
MEYPPEKTVRFQDWKSEKRTEGHYSNSRINSGRIRFAINSFSEKFQRGVESGSERIKGMRKSLKSSSFNRVVAKGFGGDLNCHTAYERYLGLFGTYFPLKGSTHVGKTPVDIIPHAAPIHFIAVVMILFHLDLRLGSVFISHWKYAANAGGSSPSLGATIYASRFAANALRALRRNKTRKARVAERVPPILLQKPAEPDFTAEEQ